MKRVCPVPFGSGQTFVLVLGLVLLVVLLVVLLIVLLVLLLLILFSHNSNLLPVVANATTSLPDCLGFILRFKK